MKIILWLSVAVILTILALLSCAFKPSLEMRSQLASDATVYINDAQASNSAQIIEELNALRAQKWRKFSGKVSAGQVLLEVKNKNTDEVVRFSLYANGIEEYGGRNSGFTNATGYSNTSGGYAYEKHRHLPALASILKEHTENVPRN